MIKEFGDLDTENKSLYRWARLAGLTAAGLVIGVVGNLVLNLDKPIDGLFINVTGNIVELDVDKLFSAIGAYKILSKYESFSFAVLGAMALINGYCVYRNLKRANENSRAMGRLEKEIEYEIEYLRINNADSLIDI